MKKLFCLTLVLLSVLLAFSLVSCGNEEGSGGDDDKKYCPPGTHDFGLWKETKKANCTEYGEQARVCLVCSMEQRQKIDYNPNGHNYVDYVCTRCQDSINPIQIRYKLSEDGSYYIIESYAAMDTAKLEIPTEYKGLPVKEIAPLAFQYARKLEEVIVPDTITKIGLGAFLHCNNIKKLTIPFVGADASSKNAVLGYIFGTPEEDTTGMYPVDQPIGDSFVEFWISPALTDVTVTGGELYKGCFQNCANIRRIVYTGKGDKVHDNAFRNCQLLDSVTLSISIAEYGSYAFSDCFELDAFPLNEGIETIGSYCFAGCLINFLSFPSTLTSVGDAAFFACVNIKNVVIPANIGKLSNSMFENCTGLESVTILDPAGSSYKVTEIGESCFNGCSFLNKVVISSTVNSIEKTAFKDCIGLKSITIPADRIKERAFIGCKNLSEVIFANGVEKIERNAFEGCVSITSVKLPASFEDIDKDAFIGCKSLTSIEVDELNPDFTSAEGNLYSSGKALLIMVAPGFSEDVLTIPEGVTSISDGAFDNAVFVKAVVFPASLLNIADRAFESHPSITSITINARMKKIGTFAFAKAPNLTEVNISGVSVIADSAFAECPSLKTVVINDVEYINTLSFHSCAKLESVTISNTVQIEKAAFKDCKKLKTLTIGENVETIGFEAFAYCEALESLIIGEGNLIIGEFAFSYCKNIKEVTFKEGTSTIGEASFEGCTSLTKVNFPLSLTSINAYAFKNCSSLTEFTIDFNNKSFAVMKKCYLLSVDAESKERTLVIVAPGAITEEMELPSNMIAIGPYVFRHATQLKKIIFPDKLKTIGREAFFDSGLTEIDFNCVENVGDYAFGQTKITSVTVSSSVKSIGKYAFQYCYDLKEIYIPSNVTTIGFAAFHNVGKEDAKLQVYVEFEDKDSLPKGWGQSWDKAAICDVHYGYVFPEEAPEE